MSFYSELAETALGVLAEFGVSGTLTKRTIGAYNTATGRAAATEAEYAVTVVVAGNSDRGNGDAVVEKTRRLLIGASGLAVTIATGDTVLVAGVQYTIVDPNPVAPNGSEVVLYDAVAST